MVNPDGWLFVEHLAQGMEMLAALQPGAAEVIMCIVAHALQTEAGSHRPIISEELPIGDIALKACFRRGSRHPASPSAAGPRASSRSTTTSGKES